MHNTLHHHQYNQEQANNAVRLAMQAAAGAPHLQMLRIQLIHLLFSQHQLIMNQNMNALINHNVMDYCISSIERVGLDDTQRPAACSQPCCIWAW